MKEQVFLGRPEVVVYACYYGFIPLVGKVQKIS